MNLDTRQIIDKWIARASYEQDEFVRMFIMYMCLDAWITSGSGKDRDDQKLEWLKCTDNPLRKYWNTAPGIKKPLHGLKKIGKVEDMRPNHRDEYKYLCDLDDFGEIMDFIHQIRCNLFHGGKSYVNTNDRELCKLSGKILQIWIKWSLIKTKPGLN